SRRLAATGGYEATLQRVAELAVPTLADWCVVHLLDQDGVARTVAVAHRDPAGAERVRAYCQRYPPAPGQVCGVGSALRTGEAELYPDVTPELLERAVPDPQQRRQLQALGLASAMLAPLRQGERVLGALVFASADTGRRFDRADLALAQELAARSALAIEHARLHHETRRSERQ